MIDQLLIISTIDYAENLGLSVRFGIHAPIETAKRARPAFIKYIDERYYIEASIYCSALDATLISTAFYATGSANGCCERLLAWIDENFEIWRGFGLIESWVKK